MDPELSLEEHALWWKEAGGSQLRQVLFWRWDPIGVSQFAFPAAHDEYDSYAGPLVNLLREHAGVQQVQEYLRETEEQTMGLSSGPGADDRRRDLAMFIAAWYPSSIQYWKARQR